MRAVLYCRVSSVEQTKNLSLPTQEKACREYCARNGYEVDEMFVDAESAKTSDRSEFRRLLEYCRQNRGRVHALVVYAVNRFARNNGDHHAIATLLRGFGISLRSVTEPIDDSPTGRLMEGILATIAQFDNDVRAERVTVGMKAAVDRGRWVWPAPIGYLNTNHRTGASLEPDPDRAAAIREAFELCAAGIVGDALLQRVRALGLTTKHGRPISQSRLHEALRQPVYAGIIRQAKWGKDQRGDFVAIVDETVFARAQAQLSRRPEPRGPLPKNDPRRTRNLDELFPLRRFARCTCGRALTGSVSRGRNGSLYAFYHCTRGCVRVAKAALEQRFVELLNQLRPHPAFWKLLERNVLLAWRGHTSSAIAAAGAARRRLTELEQKQQRLDVLFIERAAIDEQTYHTQRDKLREDIALQTIAAADATEEARDVEALLAFARHTMTHAGALWTSETCTPRRIALQWTLVPTGFRTLTTGVIEPPVTCLEFFGLSPRAPEEKGLVDLPAPTWKQATAWLTSFRQLQAA